MNTAASRRSGRISVLCIILCLTVLLAACARTGDTPLPTEEPTAEIPTTEPTAGGSAPRPTLPPTPEPPVVPTAPPPDPDIPADELFIDAAWPFVEYISELYGYECSRDNVDCDSYKILGQDVYEAVLFFPDPGSGTATIRSNVRNQKGTDEFKPVGIFIEFSGHPADWYDYLEGYAFYGRILTVTAEDVSAYGCTAAPGSDEFKEALIACWAKKLVSELMNAPEDDPMRCVEADWTSWDNGGGVSLVMRPADPDKLFSVLENACSFCIPAEKPWLEYEHFGWYAASFWVEFEQNADGSYSAPIFDYEMHLQNP